jgi:Protein of unknown function (DUF3618)
MAEANGTPAVRDPDALAAEIDRTRQDLARTIDALTERVSPANVARRAADRVREQAQRPEVQRVAGGVAAAVLVLGVVTFVLRRRRR